MGQTKDNQTQNGSDESQPTGPNAFNKDLSTEYYKLFEIVNEFDKRLLTVKGWGVTVSLLALAWSRYEIVQQRQLIADLRQRFAAEAVQFLNHKFLNWTASSFQTCRTSFGLAAVWLDKLKFWPT